MPKNILIFADGTGNESVLMPDESRTNVYKLYRATRSGPDSSIDPVKQIAFYIHGVGTPEPGKSMRPIDYIHQMFGGGLTRRIIDGYSSVISVWRPGDRIFLFGFSRGAYTARCLGHAIELFGIPTQNQHGKAISLQPRDLRAISKRAVGALYVCGYAKKESLKRTAAIEAFRKTFACQCT